MSNPRSTKKKIPGREFSYAMPRLLIHTNWKIIMDIILSCSVCDKLFCSKQTQVIRAEA
jgi:hypothetical protein